MHTLKRSRILEDKLLSRCFRSFLEKYIGEPRWPTGLQNPELDFDYLRRCQKLRRRTLRPNRQFRCTDVASGKPTGAGGKCRVVGSTPTAQPKQLLMGHWTPWRGSLPFQGRESRFETVMSYIEEQFA